MPLAIKNIFKLLDDGAHAFDANLLVCLHASLVTRHQCRRSQSERFKADHDSASTSSLR